MKITIKTNVLEAALLSAGKKDIRDYLVGVRVEASGNHYRAIGCDGHRLTVIDDMSKPEETDEPAQGASVTIPRETIEVVLKIAKPYGVAELVQEGDKWSIAGVQFTPVEGNYPDYCRVLSGDFANTPVKYWVNTKYLLDAEKQLKLLTGVKSPTMAITYDVQQGKALIHSMVNDGYKSNYVSVVMTSKSYEVLGNALILEKFKKPLCERESEPVA